MEKTQADNKPEQATKDIEPIAQSISKELLKKKLAFSHGKHFNRTKAKPLTIDQAIDYFGQAEELKLMTQFGWFASTSLALDRTGVDHIWRKGASEIDIQLKCRNLDKRDCSWSWDLCDYGKELNDNFYGRKHNYLCVIGFSRVEIGPCNEFLPANSVYMGLIPAKVIKNHLASNKLTIAEKKLLSGGYGWNKFFGIDNIRKILAEEEDASNWADDA